MADELNGGNASVIKELAQSVTQQNAEISRVIKKSQEEISELGTVTHATKAALIEVQSKLVKTNEQVEKCLQRNISLEAELARLGMGAPTPPRSMGEIFVDSDIFKTLQARNQWAKTDQVVVKSFFGSGRDTEKAALTAAALITPAVLYRPQIQSEIYGPMPRQLSIRDLLPVVPNPTGIVQWTVESGFAPASGSGDNFQVLADGAAAQEIEISLTEKSSQCKRIAAYISVTNFLLRNVAQLRSHIDTRLVAELAIKEDKELLYGTNTSSSLTGILGYSGVQEQVWSTSGAGATMADALRLAIAKAAVTNYVATGIVMHPNDFATIEITKATDGGVYLYTPSPNNAGVKRLWGLPVVESAAITQGTALVGAFGIAAELHDNEGANVVVGQPNAYFTEDKYALMAQEYVELAVYRPEAFVKVTWDSAPAS